MKEFFVTLIKEQNKDMKHLKIKYLIISFPTILLFVLTAGLPVYADIYTYVDKNGVMHFTNVLTSRPSDCRVYLKEYPNGIVSSYSTQKYDSFISQACDRYGVEFSLVKAIIKAESDFNHRAVSRAGAMGLMQIMPDNFGDLKIDDPFNPWENIMGGTWYFKKLLTYYKGKLPLALAAYNAGPTVVDLYKNIPPFRETENYVEKVMKYYYAYRKK